MFSLSYLAAIFLSRYSTLKAVLLATFCTFFKIFDIPVFWPVLVVYFIMLFGVTMKKQIKVSYFHVFISFFKVFSKMQSGEIINVFLSFLLAYYAAIAKF